MQLVEALHRWDAVYNLGSAISLHSGDGRVYKAIAKKDRRSVALKFVYEHEDLKEDGQWREVAILREMHHPNVLRLLGTYASIDSHFAFVNAFEEADTDLFKVLQRRQHHRLSESVAQVAACQIAAGLAYLHGSSVLHRDVKPANVLVYLDQDPVRYVLADFGRARYMKKPEKSYKALRKTSVSTQNVALHAMAAQTRGLGTAWYNAPELVVDDYLGGQYGFGVDVWAFGCVVFEMLAGQIFIQCDEQVVLRAMVARLGLPWQSHGRAQPFPLPPLQPLEGVKTLGQVLDDLSDLVYSFLRETLEWCPLRRMTIVHLQRHGWMQKKCAIITPITEEPQLQVTNAQSLGEAQPPKANAQSLGEAQPPSVPPLDCKVFTLPQSPPKCEMFRSRTVCQCKGHCHNFGHGKKGCSSKDLVKGSNLCKECICILHPFCLKTRFHGPRCYRHQRLFEALPWNWKAVHLLGAQGEFHLPLDIADLVEKAHLLKDDLVCLVLVALLKESVVTDLVFADLDTKQFLADAQSLGSEQAPELAESASIDKRVQKYVEVLGKRLVDACVKAADEEKYHIQISQMGRQGVARYCGTLRTMTVLGLVEPPEEPLKKRAKLAPCIIQLGNSKQTQIKRVDDGEMSSFVKDVLKCEREWKNALAGESVKEVAAIIADLVDHSKVAQWMMIPPPKKRDNYVGNFLARKLFLVCCLHGGLRLVDWSQVDKEDIFAISPDMKSHLDALPIASRARDDVGSEELSWFLHGQPGRLMFSSMWACLFDGSVEKKQEEAALKMIANGAYVTNAVAFKERSEVEPHPAVNFADIFARS